MRRFALLVTSALCVPGAAFAATCSSSAPNYTAAQGGFGVFNGTLYAPDGTPFVPHGIGVMYGDSQPSAAQILAQYPGANFVRLAIYADPKTGAYPTGASLQAYVNDLTSHGIYVEIEDHTSTDGSDEGGSRGTLFAGQQLQAQLAAYADWGRTFARDAYVGFGTDNEPSESVTPNGPLDPAALSAQQLQTYQAIRGAGNNSTIWLEINGWADPSSFAQGYNPADYANMTNVAEDLHIYPFLFQQGQTQAQVSATLASYVAAAQRLKSADGTMPVDVLEFGDSTTGNTYDANWQTSVQAVLSSGLGYAAWAWGSGNPYDGLLNGSTYASMARAAIAQGGSTGCPLPPIAIPTSAPASALISTQSVADVANLAAQGLTAASQSIASTAALATSGASSGGVLATDPTTAAVLAQGPAADVAPIVRTVTSPTGTMPTPAPVSNTISLSASTDFQTIVTASGNVTGTISGNQDTVSATGGIATINVTGSGNTVSSGPYDDTITVHSAGNTINTGGGNDTTVLAYPGQTAPTAINADAPALPPLAGAGNTFVAPAPGTGVVTLQGTLATGDRIDLTKALAGTTWNGTAGTLWNYVGATSSPAGCVISIGGKTVVLLPNGAPSGNIGSFVEATGS